VNAFKRRWQRVTARGKALVAGLVSFARGLGLYKQTAPLFHHRPASGSAILPSAKYVSLSNPYREPSDEIVKKYIAEKNLGSMSLEEAKNKLVTDYTMEGRSLFQVNCRPCHGSKADGNGPMACGFRLRPSNFTDPGTIATVVEQYVFWRIREGGRVCPPWPLLGFRHAPLDG
jgi:mono/diheme cytochrome c family protein